MPTKFSKKDLTWCLLCCKYVVQHHLRENSSDGNASTLSAWGKCSYLYNPKSYFHFMNFDVRRCLFQGLSLKFMFVFFKKPFLFLARKAEGTKLVSRVKGAQVQQPFTAFQRVLTSKRISYKTWWQCLVQKVTELTWHHGREIHPSFTSKLEKLICMSWSPFSIWTPNSPPHVGEDLNGTL